MQDANAAPAYWVTKWVDDAERGYGLGYQLSGNIVGAVFNDGIELVFGAEEKQVASRDVFCLLAYQKHSSFRSLRYFEPDNIERHYEIGNYPLSLEQHVRVLRYFRDYMNGRHGGI